MNQPTNSAVECRNIQAEIVALFNYALFVDVPSVTTDLLDTGILDSQKFVELLVQLEKKFNTQIEIEDFEMENFRCIESIANLVFRIKTSVQTIALDHGVS